MVFVLVCKKVVQVLEGNALLWADIADHASWYLHQIAALESHILRQISDVLELSLVQCSVKPMGVVSNQQHCFVSETGLGLVFVSTWNIQLAKVFS